MSNKKLNKYPAPPLPLSNWMFTATAQAVGCPKCGVSAGFHCQMPAGRIAGTPHTERCKAYNTSKKFNAALHQVKPLGVGDLLERLNQSMTNETQ